MSKFLSYEDRMIIAQRLQENASFGAIGKELGRTVQRLPRRLKSIPMILSRLVDTFIQDITDYATSSKAS